MLHEIRRTSAAVNEVYIMNTDNRPIGVLDSGLGGISVLRELVKLMPGEAFLYYGDSANAPYGTRTPEEVIDLTKKGCGFFTGTRGESHSCGLQHGNQCGDPGIERGV